MSIWYKKIKLREFQKVFNIAVLLLLTYDLTLDL